MPRLNIRHAITFRALNYSGAILILNWAEFLNYMHALSIAYSAITCASFRPCLPAWKLSREIAASKSPPDFPTCVAFIRRGLPAHAPRCWPGQVRFIRAR